eukprot:TRINITY_DN66524_c0_g1_i1.p1 TRINITY_DN66524_c0_g1~~TRINITY_DN66524_c0_g1_i1.p1  ORF type:complete len:204 (-),score=9.58 TRINITY_DN66524_c0_g1_i1:54-665(-)
MATGGFAVTLVALSMLWCSYDAVRTEQLVAGKKSKLILTDTQQDKTSLQSVVQGESPVGSLLQHGVGVYASTLTNATTAKTPHLKIVVSDACIEKVQAASQHCSTESIWFYSCKQPFQEEDPDRSFPLDEVCLAEVRAHSQVKNAKTGCCSNDPKYEGGCCKLTKAGIFIILLLTMVPILCCCCCCCASGGALAWLMKARSSS